MEIATADLFGFCCDVGDPALFDDEVGDAVLRLDFSGYAEKGLGLGHGLEFLEDFFPQHEINEAGFVFEGHEDDAARGTGALTADDHAGVTGAASIGQ